MRRRLKQKSREVCYPTASVPASWFAQSADLAAADFSEPPDDFDSDDFDSDDFDSEDRFDSGDRFDSEDDFDSDAAFASLDFDDDSPGGVELPLLAGLVDAASPSPLPLPLFLA